MVCSPLKNHEAKCWVRVVSVLARSWMMWWGWVELAMDFMCAIRWSSWDRKMWVMLAREAVVCSRSE